MGNLAIAATKGTDGYYYMQTCPDAKECPATDPNYKLYNRNASLIPIVSNPNDSSVLLSKKDVDAALTKDKDNFVKGWHYLDTHENIKLDTLERDIKTYTLPEKACLRITPCEGAVKDKSVCCNTMDTLPVQGSITKNNAVTPTTLVQKTPVVVAQETIVAPPSKEEQIRKHLRIGMLVIATLVLILLITFITFTAWPVRSSTTGNYPWGTATPMSSTSTTGYGYGASSTSTPSSYLTPTPTSPSPYYGNPSLSALNYR